MDADWPVDAACVPRGLPPDRAWQWCVLRTLRDLRLAARRGRPISRPNARRLLLRRWRRVAAKPDARVDKRQWL